VQSSGQLLKIYTASYYEINVVFKKRCIDLSAATFCLCETDVPLRLILML
jgi:hypothetical protein